MLVEYQRKIIQNTLMNSMQNTRFKCVHCGLIKEVVTRTVIMQL